MKLLDFVNEFVDGDAAKLFNEGVNDKAELDVMIELEEPLADDDSNGLEIKGVRFDWANRRVVIETY